MIKVNMKNLKLLLGALLLAVMSGNIAMAQDEISDDDLRKYALLSQSIEYMKKDISIELNKMIKAQEGMTGQRYKELSKAKGDEAKLDEMGAKDFEKQFMELVNEMLEERKEAIKAVNSELATKMVGDKGRVYKSIQSALKEDEALKARYEAILVQVAGD
jgi:hypothetical protein